MKKVLVIAVMTACMFSFVSAQDKQENFKPKAGDFSLEVGFAPFAQDGIINDGALAGFIHFTDKVALRIGLGLGFDAFKDDDGDSYIEKGNQFRLTLSPGIVYSFKGTPRLSPYIGGGLNIGFQSTTYKVKDDGKDVYTQKHPSGFGDAFIFGFGGATGFNYYFAKKLYVGAEVGLNFNFTSYLQEKVEQTGMPNIESKVKQSGTEIGLNAYPLLRLGWTF